MNGDEEKGKQKVNELEQNIAEWKEWQDNQYNPGYYIGTGRVARPISSLSKYPSILLIFGIVGVLICVITFISSGISFSSTPSIILGLIICSCLIYGGIVRLKEKKKRKTQKDK